MAKTRMLKHDLRTSEKVATWPIPLRYFWVLLWGYVDDHGKGKDNPQLIKADCFPLDDDVTSEQVDMWLERFMIDGVVVRYAVDGTRYLKVVNWAEHQKPPHPSPDKIPGPDDPRAVARTLHASLMSDAGDLHASFTPGLGLGWVGSGLKGGDDVATEPPLFCSIHPQGSETACGSCGDARRRHDKWVQDLGKQAETAAKAPRPIRHINGLCDAHRQPEASCEACAEDRKRGIA